MRVASILLGMHNPYSGRDDLALYPAPVASAGYRLWKMLHDRTGATRGTYVRGFDRRNLMPGGPRSLAWDARRARLAGAQMRVDLAGCRVLALGVMVRDALGLPADMPMVHPLIEGDTEWRWVPHPSGRNLWYNDLENRLVVGLLLEELLG